MFRSLCIVLWLIAALPGGAAVIQESFATDPVARGWRSFGDASLFRWNATDQNLDVTWDSSRTNSFFYLPLGTILQPGDDFSFSFDVRLKDIRSGTTPGKTNEFEIALGLLNYSSATNVNAFRGAGTSATYGVRNVVEFDYFKFDRVPEVGFGDTFASVVISTNNRIYPVHNPLTMTTGDTFRITFHYTASNQLLHTSATKNGAPFGVPPANTLDDLSLAGKSAFRVDSFAVISYSDAIQTGPPGSVLAHGTVDNVRVVVPEIPVSGLRLSLENDAWRAQFTSVISWRYALEQSQDLHSWAFASPWSNGTGSTLSLQDTNPVSVKAFYRIRAERP